jgi:hypothetical protein
MAGRSESLTKVTITPPDAGLALLALEERAVPVTGAREQHGPRLAYRLGPQRLGARGLVFYSRTCGTDSRGEDELG